MFISKIIIPGGITSISTRQHVGQLKESKQAKLIIKEFDFYVALKLNFLRKTISECIKIKR